MASDVSSGDVLSVVGVQENNLKNLSFELVHNQLIAITGVSGSGKSTLAIDTLYAEGGRRYIETFSPYTRQFLDRLHQPALTSIHGVRPALALEQRNRTTSSRSTVGTVTEINDYLKLIWAHHSTLVCPECDIPVRRDTSRTVIERLNALAEHHSDASALIAFPIKRSRGATLESLLSTLRGEGFVRCYLRSTNRVARFDELTDKDFHADDASELLVILDRISLVPLPIQQVSASIHQAFTYGRGEMVLILHPAAVDAPAGTHAKPEKKGKRSKRGAAHSDDPLLTRFSEALSCDCCGKDFRPPTPSLFTFNSPIGACGTCHGFGKILAVQQELIVPNPNLSIVDHALVCWSTPTTRKEYRKLLAFCETRGIDTHQPWRKLPRKQIELILHGSKKDKFIGIHPWFEMLQGRRHKMHVRVFLSRYRGELPCPECGGSRLKTEAAAFRLLDKRIDELWQMSLEETNDFVGEALLRFKDDPVTEVPFEEIRSRVQYLLDVGLGYLSLDRQSRTLSGGEHQRVNLTSLLGARLVNTLLVLDEPTIGLHQTDTARLIRTVRALQERGNTVLVVEHDPEMIAAADEVLDLGPGSGASGGEIVFQGSVEDLLNCPRSVTGRALNDRTSPISEEAARTEASPRLTAQSPALLLRGASANNLRGIDVRIPLGGFVVLTGVSGSGKSSLLRHCLAEPLERMEQGLSLAQAIRASSGALSGIDGLDQIHRVVFIDQHPIGKTPRANPATYTKAWELIRECLAASPEAERLGLSKSAFSFNVDGGRCPVCSGAGALRVEMQFLADVFVECEACGGSRFQDQVLTVRIGEKNVVELLELGLEETVELFRSLGDSDRLRKIVTLLQPLLDLGLGYLRLGHPLSVLSGGEAQRMKIASHLVADRDEKNLYVLDEPTTGLHPDNIKQLMNALRQLIAHGHSVLVVEHNLDVIAAADWVIDLGPGAGKHGGRVVAEGTPHDLARAAQRRSSGGSSEVGDSLTAKILGEWAERRSSPRLLTGTSGGRSKSEVVSRRRVQRGPTAIQVVGARHHNLRDISVDVPLNTLTVVTGVSGSGKSTFAFDIIFAEGQRRYIDCLSPYARQYLKQLSRPDVDRVANIPPTVAISQRTSPPHGISTIATVTELYQFLRLLFSKVGDQHCPHDDTPITSFSAAQMTEEIIARAGKERLYLLAPVVSGRKGYYNDVFERAVRAEITEARVDGKVIRIHPELRLERHKLHWISLFVASLSDVAKQREILREAVEQALLLGGGTIEILVGDKHGEPEVLSTARVCPTCKRGYRELDPQDFSFRSARGVCTTCEGRGTVSLGKSTIREKECPACGGSRIGPVGRHVRIGGRGIWKFTALTAPELFRELRSLTFPARLSPVVDPILKELLSRLQIITSVGLDYIRLDRDASTISGGEAQRLRLAKTLGSPLSGVCYVLDEPSIGLHPQDQSKLLSTLVALRDGGNTVIVVEHDEEMIRAGDHVIDIGPAGGSGGGRVVAAGDVTTIEQSTDSLTGRALRARREGALVLPPRIADPPQEWLELRGAKANTLRSIDVRIPLHRLSVVCGVSGAGKSSLVHGSLVPAVIAEILDESVDPELRTWSELRGGRFLDRILEIDQSPVGKTSTSTPASFLGIFDEMRKIYAAIPEARARGYSASFFSFNTGKGRCPECNGRGMITVPMSFLPDAATPCEMCGSLRYTADALEITYQGMSIGEMLQRTMSEAREFFANHRTIRRSLNYVHELGLGYLTLGQPTSTLSGGETQRLKIARELGLREAERTLYILDEPTIGLHMTDVDKLIRVLRTLIDRGNTVVVIEHNLDVLRSADYLIEVGPGPGDAGGSLLFSGTPEELLAHEGVSQTRPFLLSQGELPLAVQRASGW